MDILKLLKEGMKPEEIMEDFMDELEEAKAEYKEWLAEIERQKQALAAKEAERAFKQKRMEDARSALGASLIEYFSALDLPIEEKSFGDVDLIIDALPHIKVVKTGGKFW